MSRSERTGASNVPVRSMRLNVKIKARTKIPCPSYAFSRAACFLFAGFGSILLGILGFATLKYSCDNRTIQTCDARKRAIFVREISCEEMCFNSRVHEVCMSQLLRVGRCEQLQCKMGIFLFRYFIP